MAISPAKLFADIKATCARLRDVPRRATVDFAGKLTKSMAQVSGFKARKRHGSAEAVEGGVMVRAYTANPHFGPWWQKLLRTSARFHMRRALDGKD